jgi:hypothetical protein
MTRHLTRAVAIAAAALAVACEPPIDQVAPGTPVATAVFDPASATPAIPLPNDLVFQADLSSQPAQAEFIGSFAKAGGFPNDQEVAITIDFTREGKAVSVDLSSIRADTLLVIGKTASGSGPVAIDPITAADYKVGAKSGTLTLHNKGRQPWQPGSYLVLVRGGPGGLHTTDGDAIYPSQVFYLIAQGQDLTDPANIGLILAQSANMEEAKAKAAQLNQLVFLYGPAFAAADKVFPHQELAVLTTFIIAPKATTIELDPGRGLVPLPIDLLRDPRPASSTCAACGHLTPIAACTLAQGTLDANGVCSSAAAGGFAALDGFSTTAAMIASTSELIQAATVSSSTVFMFDLSNPTTPVLVPPSSLIYEPVELTQSGLSTAVVLQPAGATGNDPSSVLRTRPLKDNTNYAIVITDGVKDKTGAAMKPGTVGRILLFDNALVDGSGTSQLAGIDNATAGALEIMRQQLRPVVATLGSTRAITKDHIAMAYTFKTQTILKTAIQLAALPYSTPDATALPLSATTSTPAGTFAKYGINPTKVTNGNILEFIEAKILTFDLLDPATGAFNPDPTKAAATPIDVLIAVPNLSALAAGPTAVPMMVYRHGLGGGRADMLTVANTNAGAGMITVAIDAAKHGDRSYCNKGDTTYSLNGTNYPICADANGVPDGSACVSALPAGAQADAKPPGTCAHGYVKRPVFAECATNPGGGPCNWTGGGIPFVSSNFLISANFFRTRDTFRQDLIDESALIRALAVNPTAPPAGHKVFAELLAHNLVIDPTKVYFSGQSLGAIQGTASVAANPRISKAALNVGGGTTVDVFTTSPAFSGGVNQLLAGLGIAPGTSSYFQFLIVAKTILDPADPINFVGHITGNTLPDLLANPDGSVAQSPKKLLTQVAFCDQVVPNPWNLVWASTAGTGPLPIPGVNNGFGGPGTAGAAFQVFYSGPPGGTPDLLSCPAPGGFPVPSGAVSHSFLTNWANANQTQRAQTDIANFVASDTSPLSLVQIP